MVHRSIIPKTILNKTKRRDPWFLDDYTLNPYSGCSFNCWYCFIRGSKYGEQMEDKLAYKEGAVQLLEKQLALRAKKNQYGIIVLASATEPYLPWEDELQLTRQLLEVILHFRFPVHVITKSSLVVRDFDLLRRINEEGILPEDLAPRLKHKAMVTFSFSTLDHAIAKVFEPGATSPSDRLATLHQATGSGLHAGVSLMPLLPYLTDTEESLEDFYKTFKSAGARYVLPASLTLFGTAAHDSRTLTLKALQKYRTDLIPVYETLFARDGHINSEYHRSLKTRLEAVKARFAIPDSIISLS